MANEITVSGRLRVSNGNLEFDQNLGQLQFDQAAAGGPTPGYLTIGTSEESEAFSELGTLGWILMRNLDDTNYVEWGFATGAYGGRLEPNEFALFRLNPSTTVYLRANTSACKCVLYALED
jgi:hypothetical protein